MPYLRGRMLQVDLQRAMHNLVVYIDARHASTITNDTIALRGNASTLDLSLRTKQTLGH